MIRRTNNIALNTYAGSVSGAMPSAVRADLHSIKKGNTLCGLSRSYFGSERYALAIWKFNNENGNKISDPNLIYEGRDLLIPTAEQLGRYMGQDLASYYSSRSQIDGFFCPLTSLPRSAGSAIKISDYVSDDMLIKNGVDDPALFKSAMQAFCDQESGGDPSAVNKSSGALGLFQIMPFNWPVWAKEAGLPKNAPASVENQIKIAAFKMAEYYRKYKNIDDVFAAWYGGEGAVKRKEDTNSYDTVAKSYAKGRYPTIEEYVAQVRRRTEQHLARARLDSRSMGRAA